MAELKAVETKYKGCRFRSRLEARWAVFFEYLEVKWEYEKEGFELGENGRYLPDFWLPTEHVWVEIKGAAPSDKDYSKAWSLRERLYEAHFTHGTPAQTVLMAVGDIGREDWLFSGDYWAPIAIEENGLKLFRGSADPYSTKLGSLNHIVCPVCGDEYVHFREPSYLPEKKNPKKPSANVDETTWPGYGHSFNVAMNCESAHKWEMAFGFHKGFTYAGIQKVMGRVSPAMHLANNDAQRLQAAYTAARSARFEHGESG